MKTKLMSFDNNTTSDTQLNKDVFAIDVRNDLLHRVVHWQLAKRRSGNHKTKVVSEVHGTTRKPWKQKGTGRARASSMRLPHFRGGGVTFGPVVRDHGYALPKKIRKLGLKMALSMRNSEGKLRIIDSLEIKTAKTKDVAKKIANLSEGKILFIDGETVNQKFVKAISNIFGVDALPQQGANVYDILNHDDVIITKSGVKALEERLK